MFRLRGITAAAFAGSSLAALVVAALAAGSPSRAAAKVTLQVAPRGLGTVSVQPAGLDPDNHPVSTCARNEGQQSCTLSYDRGQPVTLTATGTQGRSLAAWSTPDCPGTGSCTLTLTDDSTSIVALFAPLRLGVKLSTSDAGQVTTDPAGAPCAKQPEDEADQCLEFRPGQSVKVTMHPAGGHTFKGWNPGCEPTDQPTCTVTVRDEPTWIGARFDGDDAPPLPTTISVQFQLKRGGNGSGRVTGTKLDCGTVCSAEYDYGKTVTLTVAPDSGSVFDGWNGVCSKTQTTCAVPVGPITAIKAVFTHDTSPPSAPGGLAVAAATRTSISVGWSGATDNVGVTGYRVYLNEAAAGDTQQTAYTFASLACGRTYSIGVDAVDAVGNRSSRATLTASTLPCRLTARVAGVGVQRAGAVRRIVVKLRVNRATTARLTLSAHGSAVAGARYRVRPGTNTLRLLVPRRVPGGAYRLRVELVNPDGGSIVLAGRGVFVPRPA
jgi:hypothetical protein